MSRAHSPTFPSLYLCHNSFSNHSVALHTSQLILQPFFHFSYVTDSWLMSPGKLPMIKLNFHWALNARNYVMCQNFFQNNAKMSTTSSRSLGPVLASNKLMMKCRWSMLNMVRDVNNNLIIQHITSYKACSFHITFPMSLFHKVGLLNNSPIPDIVVCNSRPDFTSVT